MTVCTDCGGTVIEYDVAAGNGFCVNCGTVVEENTIVNEVTFGETSSGAAMVQGSFVGQGATHARMGGPFGNRGSTESREQTIANASRKIQQVATAMRLSEIVQLAATRLYTLAVEHKFTKGRKGMNVVAVCLYVACRQKETRNYMLIDFSDLLQVNVFELGHTYLQLVQTLNLRLPLVDPSHYISRFAALLEFGEETPQVALDATRLVQRFDRDWMTRGRRPSGICGAALLLAARMNNFRRSVEEIVQVVKIADSTLRKRVEEFRKTGSAGLSVADFRSVWLEEEMDPPAYTKGKEKEAAAQAALLEVTVDENGNVVQGKEKKKGKGKKKRKRRRGEESSEEEEQQQENITPPENQQPLDSSLLNQGIFEGAGIVIPPQPVPLASSSTQNTPLFLPEESDEHTPSVIVNSNDPPIDPALLDAVPSVSGTTSSTDASNLAAVNPTTGTDILDETLDNLLTSEVSSFLSSAQPQSLSSALDHAEQVRHSTFVGLEDDELKGLDEDELDAFILTEEEVKIKERVWVELNKDYLEALAAKAELEASAGGSSEKKSRKRRKTHNKPRDASTPHGSTAAESVRNLIKKNPKYSKRINYDALKDLFTDADTGSPVPMIKMSNTPTPAPPSREEVDENGYVIDEKADEEGMQVVVEEGGGGVGAAARIPIPEDQRDEDADGEGDDDDMYGEESDKGEEYGEWEGYEQEV